MPVADASSRPLISVVVGVLNGARTLEQCIDSVAGQTLRARELIIKDGGSTDGTLEILQRRAGDITIGVSTPDTGLYSAWNQALPLCKGKWVCFLGADDEFATADTLSRVAEIAETQPDVDVISSLVAVTEGGRFLKTVGGPWDWSRMRKSQTVAHPGMWHRVELFQRLGGFDESYRIAGDYEFLLRLPSDTKAIFLDQVTVRMGANGMSHRLAFRTLRETWRAQAARHEIGQVRAARYYATNVAKQLVKRVIRYR